MNVDTKTQVFMELIGLSVASAAEIDIDSFTAEEVELYHTTCMTLITEQLTNEEIHRYLELMADPVFRKVVEVGNTISPQLLELAQDISNKKLTPLRV